MKGKYRGIFLLNIFTSCAS